MHLWTTVAAPPYRLVFRQQVSSSSLAAQALYFALKGHDAVAQVLQLLAQIGQFLGLVHDAVVFAGGLTHGGLQVLRLPWLLEKAKDVSLVDRCDDRIEIGVAGE